MEQQIFIKTLDGKTVALPFSSTTAVSTLKDQLVDKCGLPQDEQRLLFGSKQLEAGCLADYEVTKDSTLHLTTSLLGGFGAGNIPSYSFLEGKAFRHGDIEDTLEELLKKSSGILGGLSRGSKFGGLDIKRVYFGNWLRDYSQAMDCAGLAKLPKQTILNLIIGLGFLAHGYATGEFEVTDERLGVYLCTEHIDNPLGYAADQPNGDARHLDPRLRGPVDPRELEIDPRTGMKNYIGNEQGGWDTSSRLVRERIHQCVTRGRKARATEDEKDLHEAYRLLGTLLHTLEDFSAHSNWCELSLRRLGYHDVFCHVGDQAIIKTPSGPAPPLVTGTFGGADFLHSMLGEATDHISEASVSDLAKAMDGAKSRSADGSATDTLRDMLLKIPGGSGGDLTRGMENCENIRIRAQNSDPSTMSPQELHATLWQVLTFRDNVCKVIENTIEKIPGLSTLVEKIMDSINRLVFTTLEPLLKPIMGQATTALSTGSAQVIANDDAQFKVFNDPHASDPTHSFLSKDHFALILNQPAGLIAVTILRFTVKAIVNAWEHDNVDPNQVAHSVLESFHHPYFYDNASPIQREMGACLKQWIDSQPADDKRFILTGLTKESVRAGKNKRKGHESDQIGHGHGGEYNSILSPEKVSAFAQAHVPGASGVIGGFNTVAGSYQSVQHYIGREVDGGGFVPPEGPPPATAYGNYASGSSSNFPSNSYYPSYEEPPLPPHHQSHQHTGYGAPPHEYAGGGFMGQEHGYQDSYGQSGGFAETQGPRPPMPWAQAGFQEPPFPPPEGHGHHGHHQSYPGGGGY